MSGDRKGRIRVLRMREEAPYALGDCESNYLGQHRIAYRLRIPTSHSTIRPRKNRLKSRQIDVRARSLHFYRTGGGQRDRHFSLYF